MVNTGLHLGLSVRTQAVGLLRNAFSRISFNDGGWWQLTAVGGEVMATGGCLLELGDDCALLNPPPPPPPLLHTVGSG